MFFVLPKGKAEIACEALAIWGWALVEVAVSEQRQAATWQRPE